MGLTLQFIPYVEIETLSSIGRIRKILNAVKDDKIVLLEGRLKKEEEAELIKVTMEEINADFKGIELAVIYPETTSVDFIKKVKHGVVSLLMGDRSGLTIIGPASIVKEIKKDPNKIQLLTKDAKIKKKSTKKKKKRR
ncbi:DUF2073 domain-containing protein [Candidatus Woesearchaeota archaeon]|jgi:hypothetical protein|nr:DUF2073 domain-containing protein [Candidatus Woesearchaeota archaeon]MBT6519442.1 DUF2073 domain-containing protein [Candidatus Woesearchaeota archaeon]MBT7368896.1 DUF2073 domain-containing protein [Candidatus Woesearchaeota archaeon]